MDKLIIRNIPQNNPSILVSPLHRDTATGHDLTSFMISNATTNETLGIFHADDIVQQRNFMVALGGSGPGLFTQNQGDKVEEDLAVGLEDIDHPSSSPMECEVRARQLTYDSQSNNSMHSLPSYEWSMQQLPAEFYFSDKRTVQIQGTQIPIYNPQSSLDQLKNSQSLMYRYRRKVEDTFLPPHGSPVYHPVSIGYGSEVGLQNYQHAVWDEENKFYYFLDHSSKMSFAKELRSPVPVGKKVKKEEITCTGESKEVPLSGISRNLPAPYQLEEFALQRPRALVIKGYGRNGIAGIGGSKGRDGLSGKDGEFVVRGDGKDGEDGKEGEKGRCGGDGEDGGNGNNFILNLDGDASMLKICINGRLNTVANLGGESNEEVVFLDCHGGDGSNGGNGGVGGSGGNGGDGGKGRKGGDGGHGGDGCAGGAGGDGGGGGKSGSGGSCVVRASDPRLMMLVEVDCRVGNPGKGGSGGSGGSSGRRGYGGEGGVWEEADLSSERGAAKTVSGMNGKPGSTGRDGYEGKPGKDGLQGTNGGLLWVIESPTGEVLLEAEQRFQAKVTSLMISPDIPTYQPNQAIEVSEVKVVNCGGLPLPRGAKIFFPNTNTVRFEEAVFELPELSVNESFTVPIKVNGRIFDQSTPNHPGSFIGEASFNPRVNLLGRPFETSFTQILPVSYPVKLSFALSNRNVSRGEISSLEVGVENTSQSSYGSMAGSAGSLAIRFHLDSQLLPLGIQYSSNNSVTTSVRGADRQAVSYRLTHNPDVRDSMWIEIKELGPGESLHIPLAVMMDSDTRFCNTCVWQSDLYFKGKLIEYMTQEIHVTPAYASSLMSPTRIGDILMITSDLISEREFTLWKKIFDILQLSVDYWDANHQKDQPTPTTRTEVEGSNQESSALNSSPTEELNRPLINNKNSGSFLPPSYSMYEGKTILYPHCNLEQFPKEQILSHIGSSTSSNNMLLFLTPTSPSSLEDYFYDHTCHTRILRHLSCAEDHVTIPKETYSGYHFPSPTDIDDQVKRAEINILKKLEKNIPSHTLSLFSHRSIVNQKRTFKYKYGSMDVRKCPVPRSCNFQCVDGTGGNLTSMWLDNPLLTAESREFPLASRFGQVFLAVLVSVPLQCKLNVLKNVDDKSSQRYIKFHLPNRASLDKEELVAITIAQEVADEILDCGGTTSRMEVVANDLLTHASVYSRNGRASTLNKMLYLTQQEVLKRAEPLDSIPSVQSAVQEIIERCKSLYNVATSQRQNGLVSVPGKPPFLKFNSFPAAPTSSSKKRRKKLSCQTERDLAESHPRWSQENLLAGASGSTPWLNPKEILPSLSLLQDSTHILRSHQLRLEDECYDISI